MATADLVFGACLAVGGAILLLTLVVDDIFGGILGVLHLGFDLNGVSPMPVLLGFVSMFGIGGLFGLHGLGLPVGPATLVGMGGGVLGGAVVYGAFKLLAAASGSSAYSLTEMVGLSARVAVGIPAGRYGSVYISYAGESHELAATADADVAPGRQVKVVGVAGSNLVVEALN